MEDKLFGVSIKDILTGIEVVMLVAMVVISVASVWVKLKLYSKASLANCDDKDGVDVISGEKE